MKAERRVDPRKNPPAGLIAVGKILATQGNKGEVKVVSLTDTLERWLELTRVFTVTTTGTNELFIEKVRFHRRLVIVKFREVESISTAEGLQGEILWLPEEERPRLPEGRFYLDELIGLKVYGLNDRFLGTVEEVIQTGANDVYIVRGGEDGEILLPAIKSVVRQVDTEKQIMRVKLLPGLLDGEG